MSDDLMGGNTGTALVAPVRQVGVADVAALTHAMRAPMSLRASLTPARLALVIEEKKILDQLIQDYLEENVDFGLIPFTKKPTLYKAGAEKIVYVYECYAEYDLVASEIDHDRLVSWTKKGKRNSTYSGESTGLYRFVYRCKIIHRASGMAVAEGYGAASTMESKYVDRPRECENTVLKMSKKRALVDAVLSGFGLSERFTQDVEDIGTAAAEEHEREEGGDDEQGPEEGSLEWARQYLIPDAVKRSLKLKVDTIGQCTAKEALGVVASCELYLKQKPQHESSRTLKRAAQVYADALEEERLQKMDMDDTAPAPAAAAPAPTALPAEELPSALPTAPPTALPAPTMEQAMSGSASPASVAAAVARPKVPKTPGAADDQDDDLPF